MKISFVLMLRKETLRFVVTRPNSNTMCMIKIFIWGGITVKNASSGAVGFGGHKKLFVGGEGTEGATTFPPPLKF